jgi:paraquat-inducible protein B
MNDADLELKSLTGKAKTTLDDYGKLARHVDAKVDSLSNSAIAAMDAAKSAIKSIDGLVGEDSPTRADLDTTLQELSGAARSLRILADYLEQHPDAIIKGKGY